MKLPARFPGRTVACLILAGQFLWAHQPHDPISTIALSPNFAQDHTVLAATQGLSLKIGLFYLLKSTDGGVTWVPMANLPTNAVMTVIAFSPAYAQDQTIYVAGAGGLFVTADQGASWTLIDKTPLVSVALSPEFAADNTLFAVTGSRTLFKSTDRGQTYTMVPVPTTLTAGLSTLAVSPNFDADNTLLLGTNADGIFHSSDGGSTWNATTSGVTLPQITTLNFSPAFTTDHTAYAGTLGSGVLKSLTGGKAWKGSNTGLTDLNVSSLSLSPTYVQDSLVWVSAGKTGVFHSAAGASWTKGAIVNRALSGLATVHYKSVVAATGGSNASLFLGMYEGLWSSTNGAASWQYIDIIPTRSIRYIHLSPNYAQDHTLFISTYGSGNTWSTDGGVTWNFSNTGMQSSYTDASGISPNFAADKTAFSAQENGLERTTNSGAQWAEMQALGANTYPRGMAVSPNFAKDSTVLIGTDNGDSLVYPIYVMYQGKQYYNQGLFISLDGGDNWIPTSLNGPGIISIAFSPAFATDRTAFAASPTNGVYKSTDGGMNWTLLTLPAGTTNQMAIVAVSPNYASDQTVLIAPVVGGGILKSTDGGSTWTLLPHTSPLRALNIQISPNYANDQTFYVGTIQAGLLKFTNGGNVLSVLPFPDVAVTAVGLSPNLAQDNTLFAAGYHGLYKSTDGGNTWTYTKEPARIEESRQAFSTYQPQNPPTIVYQGSWTGTNPSSASSSNGYMTSAQLGSTATVNFYGDGVRWIGWTGPAFGIAGVQLDGVSEGTVNEYAPVPMYQQTLWQLKGFACGPHTLTLTAQQPQTPGQVISLDAFDVWISSCAP